MRRGLLLFLSVILLFSIVAPFYPIQEKAHMISPPNLSLSKTSNTVDSPSDDWPMFRHDPGHTGYSTSIAPSTSNILWTYKTDSSVRSSPAIVGDRLFFGSDDGYVYCLNQSTGELLWRYDTGYSIGESSPAVVDGKVFIGGRYLYCLNEENGELIWTYPIATRSSPTVVNGYVIIGSEHPSENMSVTHSYVYCLDANNGTLLWRYGKDYIVFPSPAVVDGMVFIGSGVLNCLNETDGSLLWTFSDYGIGHYGSVSVVDGKVYGGFLDHAVTYGGIYCLNEKTGKVIWKNNHGVVEWASPAIYNKYLVIGSDTTKLLCFDKDTGSQIWSFDLEGGTYSSPAIADGKVFYNSRKMFCINLTTGSEIWSYALEMGCSPSVSEGKLFAGSKDGNIYCFGSAFQPATYSLNLRTIDWSGNTIPSCTVNIGSYSQTSNSRGWANFTDLFTGTYLVTTRWQGNTVNQTSITISGDSVTTTVRCRIYPISFANTFKDSVGNTLVTPPLSFKLQCPNGTTTTPLFIDSYKPQNGTFRVINIMWNNTDVTPSPSPTFDPTMGNPQISTTFTPTVPPPFYIVFLTQYIPPIALVVTISLGGVMLYRRRKAVARPMVVTPEAKPSKPPQAVTLKVEQEPIEIAGGYETYGEFLKVGIKIMNHGGVVATDVSTMLEVPEALTFSEPAVPYLKLGNIRPGEFQSAIYKLKPTRCVDGNIRGVINYYDHLENRQDVDIPPIHIRNICPFLTSEGVVVADWMDMLKEGLLDSSSASFEFKGSPRMAFATAENRVRSLKLIERDEKTIDGGYCGYACYFGNAKYGGYYFATTIVVSGSERSGRITLTVYSNDPTIVTGYVHEVMEDVRKDIEATQGITVLTGKCPECGGELDPTDADEKGLIHCHHCRCVNVIPPWMRIKK